MNVSFLLMLGFLTIFDHFAASSDPDLDVINSSAGTHHPTHNRRGDTSLKSESTSRNKRGRGLGLRINFEAERMDDRGFGFDHNRRDYGGYNGDSGEFGYDGDYYRRHHRHHYHQGGYYNNDEYNGGFRRYLPIF